MLWVKVEPFLTAQPVVPDSKPPLVIRLVVAVESTLIKLAPLAFWIWNNAEELLPGLIITPELLLPEGVRLILPVPAAIVVAELEFVVPMVIVLVPVEPSPIWIVWLTLPPPIVVTAPEAPPIPMVVAFVLPKLTVPAPVVSIASVPVPEVFIVRFWLVPPTDQVELAFPVIFKAWDEADWSEAEEAAPN